MRKFIFIILLTLLGLSATGCRKQGQAASSVTAKSTNGPTDAEIPVIPDDNVQVAQVTADDTMHFNGNRFTVHSGQPVRIELINKGNRPATEIAHDFVVLKAGTDAVIFNLACAQAKENAYLPANEMDKVVAYTPLAGPRQTVTTTFTAPAPGQYVFLCNFPGHYAAGMHGMLTVVP